VNWLPGTPNRIAWRSGQHQLGEVMLDDSEAACGRAACLVIAI